MTLKTPDKCPVAMKFTLRKYTLVGAGIEGTYQGG
jgi:hypothetical protein